MTTAAATKTTKPAARPKAASKATEPIVLTFTQERETKTTWRYAEDGDEPVVGTLYVKKSAAAKMGNPEALTVTITPA